MPPFLERYRPAEHSLASLVDAAGALLAAIGRGVGDERVSTVPDARTVRYYQSLGVLDRPSRYEGREAVYGYRHLLQAVVTKLLQSEGMSLAQIQRALAGRTTEALEAAVAEALGAAEAGEPSPPSWGGGVAPPATPPLSPASPEVARTLVTREVAPGVLVTLDPRLVSDPETVLARIERALHPSVPGGSR